MDESPSRAQPGAAARGGGAGPPDVDLDGRTLPDGGMPLRSALALALCSGRSFRFRQFRSSRAAPGLQREHVACLNAAAAVSGGDTGGAEAGATELQFTPGAVAHGEHTFGVGSAGNALLLLQMLWPALASRPGESRLVLRGGTHTVRSPSFQFVQRAYAPLVDRLGGTSSLRLRRHGFHPTGGGSVEAVLGGAPAGWVPCDLVDRGPLREAFAECLVAAVPRHVAARELDTVGRALGWSGDQLRAPLVRQNEGPGNALVATLVWGGVTEVFTAIGEKGVSAENVARGVVRDVRGFLAGEGALGPCLAEQWLLAVSVAAWRRGAPAAFTCTAVTAQLRAQATLVTRFLGVPVSIEPDGAGWRVTVTP